MRPLTLILGKNGSGKSALLSVLTTKLQDKKEVGNADDVVLNENNKTVSLTVSKIAAERGGNFQIDGGISLQFAQNPNLGNQQRAGNIARTFRQEVASRFDRLAAELTLNDYEGGTPPHKTIARIIELLGTLLPQKFLIRKNTLNFEVVLKETGKPVPPDNLSSGEIEMLTIGLDCLISANRARTGNDEIKLLLIDEPDVHIHPDLQVRFLTFIYRLIEEDNVQVFIATHSTTFVATARDDESTRIIWMHENSETLHGESKRASVGELAALAGGNLLTQVFLQDKILLVEGIDDEDVWKQAIRSSNGKLKVHINRCDSKGNMDKIENAMSKLCKALLDDTGTHIAVSIRDKDGQDNALEDKPSIRRLKLKCNTIENCILSDEYLSKYEKTIEAIAFNGNRKQDNIKNQVNDLQKSIASNNDSWKITLGRLIGEIFLIPQQETPTTEHSLKNYLGQDIIDALKI